MGMGCKINIFELLRIILVVDLDIKAVNILIKK
jgi:hypothetical protein